MLVAWSLVLGAAGCAHVAGTPPERDPVASRTEAPAPGLPAVPPAATAAPNPATAADSAPVGLDPGEVMTPEELATIPDPLPRAGEAAPAPTPSSASPEAPEPRSDPVRGESTHGAVWRVQILATPDRDLADRVAAQAADRLGTTSRVDGEGSLYKVRLGGFATEGEAQGLRERAIEMGYPDAFRVKSANN